MLKMCFTVVQLNAIEHLHQISLYVLLKISKGFPSSQNAYQAKHNRKEKLMGTLNICFDLRECKHFPSKQCNA